jgi:purine-nucleoside phosphorylase
MQNERIDFMPNTPTPHNEAKLGDIAKTVLMPGDPLRAQFIAETYLENPVCFNRVRNMLGFTGTYKGKEISVMGGGMGMPSVGIYSYELFNFYNVDTIIRIGSAGAISDGVTLRDIVIAQGACSNSNYSDQYGLPGIYAPIGDFGLIRKAVEVSEAKKIKTVVGNVLATDMFYDEREDALSAWQKLGVLCAEMEAPALYLNAARAGKKALAILTISDCPLKGLSLPSEDRQKSFTEMMEIALEIA